MMESEFDRAAAARDEMHLLGLLEDWGTTAEDGQHFNFLDLNLGQLLVEDKNLQAVYDVFNKRQKHSIGERSAMRQLVCRVTRLQDARRQWERPYHTNARDFPEKFVRMDNFLEGLKDG